MEQPGGDMPCDGEKNCVTSVVHSLEFAQQLCTEFGSRCKGFVYHNRSGHFLPKIDITGKGLERCLKSKCYDKINPATGIIELTDTATTEPHEALPR